MSFYSGGFTFFEYELTSIVDEVVTEYTSKLSTWVRVPHDTEELTGSEIFR